MKVQIIQVPYDSGHKSVRMGSGPEHFLRNGFDQMLRNSGYDVEVESIEAGELFRAEIKTAFELHRLLSERVREACRRERFPLVLSGNCSSSLGIVAGIGPAQLGVVWFDGHGDFNTPETTESGFLDGMGLATATGLCWKKLAASIPGFHPISGVNVLHVGARDFSPEEKSLFDCSGVAVVGADIVRKTGIREALGRAIEALRARVQRVYLHVDLDVLDPAETPANEFAPPNGLTVGQVEEAIQMIGESFAICAGGMASYDPEYDEQGHTLFAGVRLMKSILAAKR